MLSQPATKIYLHTSEPRAAKWISDTIGEVEMERVKETVNTHPLKLTKSRSYQTERRTEPLVLPSEISGLQRLNALLKVDNMVVSFGFPYIAPVKSQPGFIPRETTARVLEIPKRPAQPTTIPAAKESSPQQLEETPKGIAAGQEPYFE
jgi:type IV secretory pathway TraG/TraD family ATPase VirD4